MASTAASGSSLLTVMCPGAIGPSCSIRSLKPSKTASETIISGTSVTPIKPRGVSPVTAPTVHVRLAGASSPAWGEDQPDILEAVIVSPGFRLNRSKSYSLPPWRRVVWLSRIPSGADGSEYCCTSRPSCAA